MNLKQGQIRSHCCHSASKCCSSMFIKDVSLIIRTHLLTQNWWSNNESSVFADNNRPRLKKYMAANLTVVLRYTHTHTLFGVHIRHIYNTTKYTRCPLFVCVFVLSLYSNLRITFLTMDFAGSRNNLYVILKTERSDLSPFWHFVLCLCCTSIINKTRLTISKNLYIKVWFTTAKLYFPSRI